MVEAEIKKKPSKADIDPKKQAEVEYIANFRTEQPSDYLLSPLCWWDSVSADQLYPNLRMVAKRFSCVPFSCIPIQRVSAESAYYERKRATMDYFERDQLLFLSSNFKANLD
jgi:hypothetical protein